MNFFRPSNSVIRAVRRRLIAAVPPRRLVEDSIKRLALPGTHWQITVFIFEVADNRVFVAEMTELDLPHVYTAIKLPRPRSKWLGGAKADSRAMTRIMLTSIHDVTLKVATDPRFKRNVIVLNGAALDRAVANIDKLLKNKS